MHRYVGLVLLNIFGRWLGDVAFGSGSYAPDWLRVSYWMSIEFPTSLARYCLPRSLAIGLIDFFVNPFLWAGIVEWLFRRFVDRPKDFPGE